MIKVEMTINDRCTICNHYGYCQIYWGSECKRQGGHRTPRLKTVNSNSGEAGNQPIMIYPKKNLARRNEKITTRKVSWNLVY